MKYAEMKEFLQKYPYCFYPAEQQKKDFDQRIANAEKRPVTFVEKRK